MPCQPLFRSPRVLVRLVAVLALTVAVAVPSTASAARLVPSASPESAPRAKVVQHKRTSAKQRKAMQRVTDRKHRLSKKAKARTASRTLVRAGYCVFGDRWYLDPFTGLYWIDCTENVFDTTLGVEGFMTHIYVWNGWAPQYWYTVAA
jgi:hypothetical protein